MVWYLVKHRNNFNLLISLGQYGNQKTDSSIRPHSHESRHQLWILCWNWCLSQGLDLNAQCAREKVDTASFHIPPYSSFIIILPYVIQFLQCIWYSIVKWVKQSDSNLYYSYGCIHYLWSLYCVQWWQSDANPSASSFVHDTEMLYL